MVIAAWASVEGTAGKPIRKESTHAVTCSIARDGANPLRLKTKLPDQRPRSLRASFSTSRFNRDKLTSQKLSKKARNSPKVSRCRL